MNIGFRSTAPQEQGRIVQWGQEVKPSKRDLREAFEEGLALQVLLNHEGKHGEALELALALCFGAKGLSKGIKKAVKAIKTEHPDTWREVAKGLAAGWNKPKRAKPTVH